MTESVLTKKQAKVVGRKTINYYGDQCNFVVVARYDDECGNGHNTFSITGTITNPRLKQDDGFVAGGCLHDEIAKHFPELAPLIKWHLCSSDGSMHLVENTLYHVLEHGPTHAWVYFTGKCDRLHIADEKERLIGYEKADIASRAEGQHDYRVQWDQKTVKVRNLDHARSSAVWPDAADEDLTSPGLKERLEARLPALMQEFRQAAESLGFVF